jgi:hypothetical protein
MSVNGYWVSPSNKLIPVDGDNHIQMVIQKPEVFGLTKNEVNAEYLKYGEPVGQENKARESIILGLVKRGWIRIRQYNKPYYISFNVNDTNNRRTMNRVSNVVFTLLSDKVFKDRFADASVTGLQGPPVKKTLEELSVLEEKLLIETVSFSSL